MITQATVVNKKRARLFRSQADAKVPFHYLNQILYLHFLLYRIISQIPINKLMPKTLSLRRLRILSAQESTREMSDEDLAAIPSKVAV